MILLIFRKVFFWALLPLMGMGFLGGVCLWAYINYAGFGFRDEELKIFLDSKPTALTEILDDDGKILMELPVIDDWHLRTPMYRRTVSFEQIPRDMVDASLAAEDQRFFTHHGIDYQAIVRAALEVMKES